MCQNVKNVKAAKADISEACKEGITPIPAKYSMLVLYSKEITITKAGLESMTTKHHTFLQIPTLCVTNFS